MDGRKNNGGHKTAGRKPKADEQQLIERLSPLEDDALKALEEGIKARQNWAVKLFFEYRYCKPQQNLDISSNSMEVNIAPIEWVTSKDYSEI